MFLLYSFGNLGYVFVLFIRQFKLLGGGLFICAYANAICAYAHQKRVIFFNAMVICAPEKGMACSIYNSPYQQAVSFGHELAWGKTRKCTHMDTATFRNRISILGLKTLHHPITSVYNCNHVGWNLFAFLYMFNHVIHIFMCGGLTSSKFHQDCRPCACSVSLLTLNLSRGEVSVVHFVFCSAALGPY